jgi:KDO2-lipid IV(A) lauroyltransferase
VVLRVPPTSPGVRKAARAAFRYDALNWVDTLRIARITDDEILDAVELTGWEHLEAALRQGRGVVFVVMHLGNIDLIGHALAARGARITIPVEHMQPESLFAFLLHLRRSKGINVVPIESASRELARALKAGEVAAVAGDRNVAGRGTRVEFFGQEAILPRGPVALARHTGAPVVVGLGIRTGFHRFKAWITPPLPLVHSGNAESDQRENARRIASAMEEFIARFPQQWLLFTQLWEQRKADNLPATIKHPTEAAV